MGRLGISGARQVNQGFSRSSTKGKRNLVHEHGKVIELDESLFWNCRKRMGKFLRTFFRFCRIIPKSRTANRTRTPSSLFQGLKSIHDSAGVYRNEQEIPLTKTEYEILLYLFQNSNHVLTHSQIYERIWREPGLWGSPKAGQPSRAGHPAKAEFEAGLRCLPAVHP